MSILTKLETAKEKILNDEEAQLIVAQSVTSIGAVTARLVTTKVVTQYVIAPALAYYGIYGLTTSFGMWFVAPNILDK